MATKLKLGTDNNWATKKGNLLAYNDENGNFKPIPFDVTRASTATRLNKAGLIETVEQDRPRVEFDNNDGYVLLEPTRTNQFTNSENLANIDFQTNSTVTTDNIIAPNGSLTADKTTQTSGGYLRETVSVSNGTTYSFSVFFKKGDLRYAVVRSLFSQNGVTPANSNNVFDLDNGSVIYTGTDIVSASIEAYSNDWYRCSFVSLASGASSAPFIDFYFSSSSSSTQSSGTAGFGYGWGMQLEAGSYETSYIPTQGSAVTRTFDSCINGGDANLFDITEGTLFVDTIPFTREATERITLSNNDYNNRILISKSSSTQLQFIIVSNNITVATYTTNINYNERNKIALNFKENEFKFYLNGSLLYTDTSGSVPTGLNDLSFKGIGSALYWSGKIYQAMVFNEALTDQELIQLTS